MLINNLQAQRRDLVPSMFYFTYSSMDLDSKSEDEVLVAPVMDSASDDQAEIDR
jgi:hypothetical protein